MQNGAAALRNGGLIGLFGFLHADGRIVNALDDALGAFFQQSLDVRPAAATAVQHLGIRRSIQKLKPPSGHRTMSDVHHGDHEFPAKAHGLAGVFKERHITPPISHIPHRSMGMRLSEQRFSVLTNRFAAGSTGIPRSSICCGEGSLPAS